MTTTTDNQTTQAQWDDANRFLDQLFIDPILANNYQQISQQANGQDDAPEILTSWLEEQGYDTTPDLVYDALIALQNTSLTYWSGVYGQSFFEDNQPAPVLVIAPNAEGNTVAYLDGVELKNFVFESVETDNVFHPVLSWNLDSNETAGKITFYYTSGVTLDSEPPTGYTGNWFEGTLQTSVSSVSQKYYGAIGEPTDSSAIPQLILADGEGESFWDKYSTYVYVGIGAITLVVSAVIIATLIYRKRRVDDINFQDTNNEPFKPETNDPVQTETSETKIAFGWLVTVREEAQQAEGNNFNPKVFQPITQEAVAFFKNEKITKAKFLQFISEEKERHELYLESVLQKVKQAERQGLTNMNKADVEQWLLNESYIEDPLGHDFAEAFLQKMEERKKQRQDYLSDLDRLVQLAKSKNLDPNMTEDQAGEWLLGQGGMLDVIDPDGSLGIDHVKQFLKKMQQSEPSEQVDKPLKPDVSNIPSESDKKSDIAPNSGEVVSTNQQGQKLDDKVIPTDLDKKLEESKKNDPKKIDSTSHEVKPREGFK